MSSTFNRRGAPGAGSLWRWAAGVAVLACLAAGEAAEPSGEAEPEEGRSGASAHVEIGPARSAFDAMEIRGRSGAEAPADRGRSAQRPGDGDLSLGRIVLALGVVLGAIFAVRWAGRRFFSLQAGGGSSGGIRILSRMAVAPKQQLMLVQVGRRVMLVGNSGTQMSTLCEISDPEEVAGLMGAGLQRSGAIEGSFKSLIGRAGAEFEKPRNGEREALADEGMVDEAAAGEVVEASAGEVKRELEATRRDLGGLLEKVRTLSQNFRRA